MNTKVLTPECVKCGTQTLQATLVHVSVQIGPVDDKGIYEEYKPEDCFICDACKGKYGVPLNIKRVPGSKDVGTFHINGRDIELELFLRS